jgi:hypothetical protein
MNSILGGTGLRRRLAPLLLLLGGAGIYATVGKDLPHEQTVALDLGRDAADVTGLELTFLDPRAKSDEPVRSTRWNFAPGTAPRRVEAKVRLADGEWNTEVEVERKSSPETRRVQRRVDLRGGQVVLPLGDALP